MRQFIFYDTSLDEDDVFASSTKAQIERTKQWQSTPLRQPKFSSVSTRVFDTSGSPKGRQAKPTAIEDKLAGLSINTNLDFERAATLTNDELNTPPLSPTSYSSDSEYNIPETPLDTVPLPLDKISDVLNLSTFPGTTPDVSGAEKTTPPSMACVHAVLAPIYVGENFDIDPTTLNTLHTSLSECSTSAITTIDSKHFGDLCQYMFDNDLHDRRDAPLEELRKFRPLNTSKMVALVEEDAQGDMRTNIYSCDRLSGTFHRATFADLVLYLKVWTEEIAITCQTPCAVHSSNPSIWTFETSGIMVKDGEGTVLPSTLKSFANERKRLWKRKRRCEDFDAFCSHERGKKQRLR